VNGNKGNMHSKMFGRNKIRLHHKGCGYTEGVAKTSLTVFLALATIMLQIGKKNTIFLKDHSWKNSPKD